MFSGMISPDTKPCDHGMNQNRVWVNSCGWWILGNENEGSLLVNWTSNWSWKWAVNMWRGFDSRNIGISGWAGECEPGVGELGSSVWLRVIRVFCRGELVGESVVGVGLCLIIFEMTFDESSKKSYEGLILGVMEPNGNTVSSNVTCHK